MEHLPIPLATVDPAPLARATHTSVGETFEAASAEVLTALAGGSLVGTGSALAALKNHNAALVSASPEAIRAALARQSVLLEALFITTAARATAAGSASARAKLTHVAVNAQQACARTLALLAATAAPDAPPDPAEG
jgi:hypothetical protein